MRYEPAAKLPPPSGCQSGTHALGAAIRDVFPELQSLTLVYGCYNHRLIEGSSSFSLHAEGRALDVGVPPAATKDVGWELACTLVEQRITLGTMRVIWDGHIWSTEKPDKWRKLSLQLNQHHDHVHVEQFWKDAKRAANVVLPQYTDCLREARKAWPAIT